MYNHVAYDLCKQIYDDCMEDIDHISKGVKEASRQMGYSNYDPNKITSYFDVLLQYSLLQALSDEGSIDDDSVSFIKDLTKNDNIIDYLNRPMSRPFLRWDNIFYSNTPTNIRGFLEMVYKTYKLEQIVVQ